MTQLPSGRYCAYLCARAELAVTTGDVEAMREFLEQAQVAMEMLRPSPPCERCVKRIEALIEKMTRAPAEVA